MDVAEVEKVARLARLKLTDEELRTYGRQLSDILDYVGLLDEVDTEDVLPMPHAVETHNNFRADDNRESLPRDEALANAPRTDGKHFCVPPILEEKPSK